MAHEPRQAQIAGQAYVRLTLRADRNPLFGASMVDLIISLDNNNAKQIKMIIEDTLTQINDNDISNISAIYIIDKRQIVEVFKGFSIPIDPIYIRKGENGKPCIIISNEYIFQNKRTNIVKLLFFVIRVLLICLGFIPLIVWGISNKNLKLWYILGENSINKKYLHGSHSRVEIRLVNAILFQIGINCVFDKYCSDQYCLNINAFEYATKYRNDKIKSFNWMNPEILIK